MAGPRVATGFHGSSHGGLLRGIAFLLAFRAGHRETQTQNENYRDDNHKSDGRRQMA
jgi:hypothetical protein